jgi:hypothetical protein
MESKRGKYFRTKEWKQAMSKRLKGKPSPIKGIKRSEETKRKLSLSKMSEKNPNWKVDGVGSPALHYWIRRHKPRVALCENCKKQKPLDAANISGEYKRDINDFKWLCRHCHMMEDGRMKNLINQGVLTYADRKERKLGR